MYMPSNLSQLNKTKIRNYLKEIDEILSNVKTGDSTPVTVSDLKNIDPIDFPDIFNHLVLNGRSISLIKCTRPNRCNYAIAFQNFTESNFNDFVSYCSSFGAHYLTSLTDLNQFELYLPDPIRDYNFAKEFFIEITHFYFEWIF